MELSFREKVNNCPARCPHYSPYFSYGTTWVKLCRCQNFVYFVIIAFVLIIFTVDQLLMLLGDAAHYWGFEN